MTRLCHIAGVQNADKRGSDEYHFRFCVALSRSNAAAQCADVGAKRLVSHSNRSHRSLTAVGGFSFARCSLNGGSPKSANANSHDWTTTFLRLIHAASLQAKGGRASSCSAHNSGFDERPSRIPDSASCRSFSPECIGDGERVAAKPRNRHSGNTALNRPDGQDDIRFTPEHGRGSFGCSCWKRCAMAAVSPSCNRKETTAVASLWRERLRFSFCSFLFRPACQTPVKRGRGVSLFSPFFYCTWTRRPLLQPLKLSFYRLAGF